MMKAFLAIFAALLAQLLLIGVETVAGIEIAFLPRILISVPLTLLFEFPMLVLYEEVKR